MTEKQIANLKNRLPKAAGLMASFVLQPHETRWVVEQLGLPYQKQEELEGTTGGITPATPEETLDEKKPKK